MAHAPSLGLYAGAGDGAVVPVQRQGLPAIVSTVPEPAPAIPPFEPPPLPASLTDSGRRILWIIGLYRAVCGAALFGIALLVDL